MPAMAPAMQNIRPNFNYDSRTGQYTTLTRPERAFEQATLARGDSSQARQHIGIARRVVIMRSDESRLRFVESYFLRSQAIEGIDNGSS
jgi:hypothetical protein